MGKKDYKITELEMLLEDCERFLELIPLEEMSKGHTWHPSEEALVLGRMAKRSINRYVELHIHPLNNS